MNLYQHAKCQAVSSTCFGDMADIEMLESDCLRTFWPYLRNWIFPEYGICAKIQQVVYTFITEQIQKKLMTKFFNNSKKPYFRLISEAKNFFPKNPNL